MNDSTQRIAKAAVQMADRMIKNGEGLTDAEWTIIQGKHKSAAYEAWEFLQVLKESRAGRDDIDQALEDFYEAEAGYENIRDFTDRRSYLIGIILKSLEAASGFTVSLEDLR